MRSGSGDDRAAGGPWAIRETPRAVTVRGADGTIVRVGCTAGGANTISLPDDTAATAAAWSHGSLADKTDLVSASVAADAEPPLL